MDQASNRSKDAIIANQKEVYPAHFAAYKAGNFDLSSG